MAHFHYNPGIPNLPTYLFESDLLIRIIPPQSFTVVPIKDGRVLLHWTKHEDTVDSTGDLYAELYRSQNLVDWNLIQTLNYPTTDYYYDSDVLTKRVYYYKMRFVRLSGSTVINYSDYTIALAARIVTLLSFEPSDNYSNKFFQALIAGLPGTRIYDHTTAGNFSAKEQNWQTASQMLDGFTVYANSAPVAVEPTSTEQYAKRPVSFFLSDKFTKLHGKETSTGALGEFVQINSYLIYTFLMSYAQQFMSLYQKYLQIVADKYVDFAQTYTKGFKPVVSDEKEISIADLYYNFGSLLNLKPLKSHTLEQGLQKYKQVLKDSFSNIDNVGKFKALDEACRSTLGITQQTIFEHKKFHWFKSDREFKLYAIPSGIDPRNYTTHNSGINNDLIYTAQSDAFSQWIEYYPSPSGIGLLGNGEGWLEVLGSGGENPYTYLFRAHISEGITTANDIISLITGNPVASGLLSVALSGLDSGAGAVVRMDAQLLALRTFWAGWEDSWLKLNSLTYLLKDKGLSFETGNDYANSSRILALSDRQSNLVPGSAMSGDEVTIGTAVGTNNLIAMRDDENQGAGFHRGTDPIMLLGNKRSLFKIGLTTSGMQWLTKAYLNLYCSMNTNAGYLRLYRIRRPYDVNDVCWDYRDSETFTGYHWNGTSYEEVSQKWVARDWEVDGAESDTDAVFLKEFYVGQITSATWLKLDVTDILQQIYKYETSRLTMGNDPENILECGFMLVADGFPNRSVFICSGHSDATYKPYINWERLGQGYYQPTQNSTTYFYTDGTTRYGRLLVMQSDKEPVHFKKTVNERIRNENIQLSSDMSISFATAVPADFVVGLKIYGLTSGAIGKITTVGDKTIFVSTELKSFTVGETLRLLEPPDPLYPVTIAIASISYVGNKYIRLSRTPISNSIIRVYHSLPASTPIVPLNIPSDYPAYAVWSEAGAGIAPVFISNPLGTLNVFATQDENDPNIIHLNTSNDLSAIGDVIITYQYEYDFVLLGRAITDNQGITALEGCSRVGSHLYSESEKDQNYKTEVMLPMPSSGEFIDISGNSLDNEYSDYNLGLVCDAISNIRRLDAITDVFKYLPQVKPFRTKQMYHTFLRKA